jgi:lipopolysaccharide transport system ATP-binding protein
MTLAMQVENLGKRYRITATQPRGSYRTLRESLMHAAAWPIRRLRGGGEAGGLKDFWALRDVNFEVQRGEAIGIIGRNGAGKSTLLKILSRIVNPSAGEARLHGRVASLLEVGTGFHPELTGRENIYLNGAIMGMSRAEVQRKFDEIVAFSEVEEFLDTPVKRYSSGMYVRLAFAVAAHLESDILLVDEVLAVGDATFQQKCLGKIREVGNDGRTVFFVSHNMAAVQNLCRRVIILKDGRIIDDGDPERCISAYLKASAPTGGNVDLRTTVLRRPGQKPFFTRLEVLDADGHCTSQVRSGDPVTFRLHYDWTEPLLGPRISVGISTMSGTRLLTYGTRWNHGLLGKVAARGCLVCEVPELPLMPGEYVLTLACGTSSDAIEVLEGMATLTVEQHDYFGTGQCPLPRDGLLLGKANWEVPVLETNGACADMGERRA